MNKIFFLTVFILFLSFQIVFAQNDDKVPRICTGGVVNSKATYLPQPDYPKQAKDESISGVVNIRVSIDEQGNVSSAEACSGHLLLREGAKKAALKAKFKPTVIASQPVKVSGILIYKFVQDKSKLSSKEENPLQKVFEPKAILGGIINGSAITLETPEYPEDCQCPGFVFVQVVFDTITNEVESAIAVSGNPILRIASVEAVKKSKFRIHDHFRSQDLKVVGFVAYRFGQVKWKNEDLFSPEARKLFENYKKMDSTILLLAAYSFDQTMTEKLKDSEIFQNGKTKIEVELSNNSAKFLQKAKQIGFEIIGNEKAKILTGKIKITNLIKLAEIKEIIKISS